MDKTASEEESRRDKERAYFHTLKGKEAMEHYICAVAGIPDLYGFEFLWCYNRRIFLHTLLCGIVWNAVNGGRGI